MLIPLSHLVLQLAQQLQRSHQLPGDRPQVPNPSHGDRQAAGPPQPHQGEGKEPSLEGGDPGTGGGGDPRHHQKQDRHKRRLPEAQPLGHPAVPDCVFPLLPGQLRDLVRLLDLSFHHLQGGVRRRGEAVHHQVGSYEKFQLDTVKTVVLSGTSSLSA